MINVTFVTIVASSYFLVVPGYEAGIEYVRQSATNVAFQYIVIHNRSIATCEVMANHHTHLAAEYFYTRRQLGSFIIFIAPYCSQGELLDFAPLANRESSVNHVRGFSLGRTAMSGNDYVFFHIQPYTQLPLFPSLVYKNGDGNDEVARSAFTSLFSVAFATERNIDLLPETSRRFILDRSEVIYNLTYQPNERTAMLFRSSERQLNVSRPEGVIWQGGTVPPNEPVCGFTGKNPICQPSGISLTSLILAALGGLAALALMIGLGTRIVLRHLIDQTSEKWWQLTNVNVRSENWPTGISTDDGSIEADVTDENLMENDPKSFPKWQPVLY
ncbi:hypothetical protein BV898_14226 [Hypsibius exemplaris]|uniref:Receptor ligand binding region domain-containing protein n=1 Tax=Hypsibius exemplaris TaxID=2072580 RepID=A0A1W0W8G5_HYPEX|nr:hypothetical protein BV898_14226 [Hypsibius exemplaris]